MKPRKRSLRSIFVLLLALPAIALLPAGVRAQPALEGPQAAPDLVTQAKAHYELGMTAYGLGHFDRAIDSFIKAYQLDPAPVLLYNIAQAHWKKGTSPESAVAFYRRYLEADPNTENLARIKSRIRELETEMKQNPRPMPTIDPTAAATSRRPITSGGTGVLGATAVAAPDLPAGTGSNSVAEPLPAAAPTPIPPPVPAPPARARGQLAAATLETPAATPRSAPSPSNGPYWQPPQGNVGIPAAGRPAPMDRSSLMPEVLPSDWVNQQVDSPPVYRRPWFWAGVGTVTLLGVAAFFLLRPDQRWSCGGECVSTQVVP